MNRDRAYSIFMFVFLILVILLAAVYETDASEPVQFSIQQGCGPNEGRNNIYTVVYELRGADALDLEWGIMDQGGNALMVYLPTTTVVRGRGVWAEIYLDVDSFVTLQVNGIVVTVRSGERPCPNVWKPSALEVEIPATPGHCYYAHWVNDLGIWLLTDKAHPGGIIWKATDAGFVELILDAYGDADPSHYLLTETECV